MLLIVAHHYVVNSGLATAKGPIFADPLSMTSLGLLVMGGFGKIGINCFVMISGYFMCKSSISVKKFARLFLEVKFYRLAVSSVFWICGLSRFSLKTLWLTVAPFTSVASNFTGTYLLFFLFIPFLNILIRNMTEKQHLRVTALFVFVYVILGTMERYTVTMNYISWFTVLYLTAAYIRLYPKKLFSNGKVWTLAAIVCFILCCVSIVWCTWSAEDPAKNLTYYYVMDSNKSLAYVSGIAFFLFFKNLKIKPSRFINTVSATTFGVLLIHSNSANMRDWLWKDTLKNVEMYDSKWVFLHAFVSVVGIFTVCCIIDLLRIHLLEKPFFKLWDKHFPKIGDRFAALEETLCKKWNIQG